MIWLRGNPVISSKTALTKRIWSESSVMTTPSFSVSRMGSISCSDCGVLRCKKSVICLIPGRIAVYEFVFLRRRSSTCLTYTSLATSRAPWLHMHRNIRSPLWSMNVTSSRFTMRLQPWADGCAFFQVAFSSLTHGATSRPCRVHSSCFDVLVMIIFSIRSFSLVVGLCKSSASREDLRHGARRLGLHTRRLFSIGAASPSALSLLPVSHRGRIHGFRPVERESRKLFVEPPHH